MYNKLLTTDAVITRNLSTIHSLFGNEISDIGVRKLAKALLNNESLEKLE